MKDEVAILDATPQKRSFLAIVVDYGLNTGVCELVDNAIDSWQTKAVSDSLDVRILYDDDAQTLTITDNAGGVPFEDLKLLVGPGQTSNDQDAPTIGFFGVGSKRAVAALAKQVTIKTRHDRGKTYQIDLDEEWFTSRDWKLPCYETDAIPANHTIVELSKLRDQITNDALDSLKAHLELTYAPLIKTGLRVIFVNYGEAPLRPNIFRDWAYPPGREPREIHTTLKYPEGDVAVTIKAGLSLKSSAIGEFGVTFYCNGRLICRNRTDYNVGFGKGQAGEPHVSNSLVHAIVHLDGPAQLMPWNSLKSNLQPNASIFQQLRPLLTSAIQEFATFSKRTQGDWPRSVFQHRSGKAVQVVLKELPSTKRALLPKPPPPPRKHQQRLEHLNAAVLEEKIWARGVLETIMAVEQLQKSRKLQQRNRICLILLDSVIEIAFKDFLVNESKNRINDRELTAIFANREAVQKRVLLEVKSLTAQKRKLDHFYLMRCNLVHRQASGTISDTELAQLLKLSQQVLATLFGLKFPRQ